MLVSRWAMDPLILTHRLTSQLDLAAMLLYDPGFWLDLAIICRSACSSHSGTVERCCGWWGSPSPPWQLAMVSLLAPCPLGSSQTSLLHVNIQGLDSPCSHTQLLGGMRCCYPHFAYRGSEASCGCATGSRDVRGKEFEEMTHGNSLTLVVLVQLFLASE